MKILNKSNNGTKSNYYKVQLQKNIKVQIEGKKIKNKKIKK